MKNILNLSILTIASIVLFSCSSTSQVSEYKLTNKPPFNILNSFYQTEVGVQQSVKNVILTIETDNSAVILDSIYFRNKKALLEKAQNNSNNKYVAHFTFKNNSRNLNLHSDSKKEFGNQVPDFSTKIPFNLKQNEAVVSYLYKGKTTYFKVINIKEKL